MPDLSGKIAIVTGCASGIGAATVRRFLSDGAQVLGTDINADAGQALCDELGATFLQFLYFHSFVNKKLFIFLPSFIAR